MLKTISRTLLYLPLLWLAVGIVWLPQGSKPMVAIVLPVVLFYVLTHGYENIKINFKRDYWLAGVLFSVLFVSISYLTHGASSQELRALLISLFYLSVLPMSILNIRKAQLFLFLSSLSSFFLSGWFYFIEPTDRILWPSNPVPLAIHQGLVYCLSASLMLLNNSSKNTLILVASMLLSGFSVFLTESRGPILGVVCFSLLVVSILVFKRKISIKYTLVVLALALLTALVAKNPIADRISDTSIEINRIKQGDLNSSIGLRIQMYLAGFDLFFQKPILGHGEISSEYASEHAPGYSVEAYGYMKGHLHNNYIDKLVKSGVIGLSMLLFLLFYPLYLSITKYKRYFCVLVLPSTYFIAMSLFDSPFRNGDTAVLYLIVIGLILHTIGFIVGEPDDKKI